MDVGQVCLSSWCWSWTRCKRFTLGLRIYPSFACHCFWWQARPFACWARIRPKACTDWTMVPQVGHAWSNLRPNAIPSSHAESFPAYVAMINLPAAHGTGGNLLTKRANMVIHGCLVLLSLLRGLAGKTCGCLGRWRHSELFVVGPSFWLCGGCLPCDDVCADFGYFFHSCPFYTGAQGQYSRGPFLAAMFLLVFWILFWEPWWSRFVGIRGSPRLTEAFAG